MKKLLLTLAVVLTFVGLAKAETAEITFSDKFSANSTELTDISINNEVSVSFAKGSGSTAPQYYTNGTAVRWYAGNTMTIKASSTITSIEVVFGTSDGTNAISTDVGTWSSPKWTGSSNTVVFSEAGSSGNRRIAGLIVTYGGGGGSINPDPGTDPDPDPGPTPSNGTVTFDATAQGYANAEVITSYNSFPVSFAFSKGTNSNNAPAYYTTGTSIRCYGGNTITISVPEDYSITEVTYTFGSGDGTNAISADVGNWSSPNWTGSASTVKFTIGGTSGHRRIQKIEVTYVSNGGNLKPADLTFSENVATATIGSGFSAPTLSNPNNLPVVYESTNPKVATIDPSGNVSILALGSTTIKATSEATSEYYAGNAEYKLNVVVDGVYTVAQALEAIENGYNANAQVKGYIIDVEEVSTSYGNATYTIADEADATEGLVVFRGYWFDHESFTSIDQIAVGGLVTVEGTLVLYGGHTPEVGTGNWVIAYTAPVITLKSVTPENGNTITMTNPRAVTATVIYSGKVTVLPSQLGTSDGGMKTFVANSKGGQDPDTEWYITFPDSYVQHYLWGWDPEMEELTPQLSAPIYAYTSATQEGDETIYDYVQVNGKDSFQLTYPINYEGEFGVKVYVTAEPEVTGHLDTFTVEVPTGFGSVGKGPNFNDITVTGEKDFVAYAKSMNKEGEITFSPYINATGQYTINYPYGAFTVYTASEEVVEGENGSFGGDNFYNSAEGSSLLYVTVNNPDAPEQPSTGNTLPINDGTFTPEQGEDYTFTPTTDGVLTLTINGRPYAYTILGALLTQNGVAVGPTIIEEDESGFFPTTSKLSWNLTGGLTYVFNLNTSYNADEVGTYLFTWEGEEEPEPVYTATFNFTGIEDAYMHVTLLDYENMDEIELTDNSYVISNYAKGGLLYIIPKEGYTLDITCENDDVEEGKQYAVFGMGGDANPMYVLQVVVNDIDFIFDINVTKARTPEVTFNFTGNYQDIMFAANGDDVELTSSQYVFDMSDVVETSEPAQFTIIVPDGYEVSITADVAETPGTTYQVMSVDQNGIKMYSIGVWAGGVGASFTVNVAAEEEEIPADAYVVYYNGEVASNLNQYGWWNASWNAQAMNPDGVGMAFEFKAADGGAAASMGLAGKTAEVVGKLHNATLNFDWYTVGNGTYKLQLTGGGKNYFYDINPADVPAGTDVTWNNVSIDIATEWPDLAEAWNVNTAKDEYLFAVLLSDGEEGDAIYFNKIYYTNVDESWTAPEAPAPETIPTPEQPQNMMLSFVTQYGQEAYNVGDWGQSTQAENTTIDGKPVIAMTNFNYLGLVNFDINISDYDYMHVDYWTPNENTPFGFVPISLNPTQDNPIWNAETVNANEWNSYDVALTFWENVDMTSIEQIKFVANQQGGTTPYGYIANVYFWKEAQEVEPTIIYVMGSGDGLTWETFPGMKVEGENGIVTFNVNNLVSFKASTVEASSWEEFNEGAYATGNTIFGDAVANAGGQTLKMEPWGENQSVPWKGNYTITMNFNTLEMTAFTTTPKPLEAPVMYVRGSMNGWGTNDAWKFTNESWDAEAGTGTYSIECKLAPGQTFKFDDGSWGNYNFGGNGAVAINEEVNLVWNGGDLSVSSEFDGKITLNLTGFHQANAIFEMEGPVQDPDQFYVIGTLAEGAWNPTVGVMMESNGNGKYTAEKVTLIESEGSTGFAITANLGTDSNDWTTVNALRFGPADNDAMAVIGENTGLAMGDLSWTFTPGTYTMVFDYTNKTLNIEEYVEPELPDNIDVTFDFNSYDNVKEYAGLTGTMEQEFSQQGSNRYYIIKKLENGGIELTGDKGTYTGSLPYNSPYVNLVTSSGSMTFRMQPGNTFTISAPEGYTLKNVTFGGTSASYISGPVLVAGEPGTIGAATTSSPYTRTWTAPEEGTVNNLTFTLPSGSSCIIKTINVVAEKVEEPALNTLVFEDWTMEVGESMEEAATAEVAINLDAEEVAPYQGFQFDITLPEGLEVTEAVANTELNGTASSSLFDADNNTYRVVVYSDWAEGGYTLTEDLVTLTVATTYPSEDGMATLIAAGDYDVTLSKIIFSDVKGNDVKGFEDFVGTVTIVNMEIPATAVAISDAYLLEPSYNNIGTNLDAEGELAYVTAGQKVGLTITVDPSNTTDELVVVANNGATVTYDAAADEWILDTTDATPGIVTVTATAGEQEATWTIIVKAVVLGDSNDNGTVNVADVVTTANFIVGNENDVFDWPNANVITSDEDVEGNRDGITVEDVTATVNIALDLPVEGKNIRRRTNSMNTNDRLVADNFRVVNDKPFVINVNLDNQTDYAALQAVVIIPEGMKVVSVTQGPRAENHRMSSNISGNELKVVLFSTMNQSFLPIEGSLFNITVVADEDCGNLYIEKIHASDASSNGYDLSFDGGLNESSTTAIDGIDAEEYGVEYFTVDGIRVLNPEKGQILIRVQNGEATKVLVK